VISLAIAVQMLKFVWFSEFQPKLEPPVESAGWWEKLTYGTSYSDLINENYNKPKPEKDREPIGSFAVRRST
jgi:hypothetical protein